MTLNIIVDWLVVLLGIQEAPGSVLTSEASLGFFYFPQYIQANDRILPYNSPQSLSST